jgi:DNA-binding response OmpR family regulator
MSISNSNTRNNILLITDQTELLYGELLRSAGFEVDTVKGIEQAWKALGENNYELALVAVTENAADALEFCDEVKKSHPSTRVALLTSWHVHVPKNECPDDVIRRDYNPQNFLSQVSELFPASSAN